MVVRLLAEGYFFKMLYRIKAQVTKKALCKGSFPGRFGSQFKTLQELAKDVGQCGGKPDLFRLCVRELEFRIIRAVDLDACNGIDADERKAVFSGMVVGTFQQDRIAVPVTQAQVDAYRCINI